MRKYVQVILVVLCVFSLVTLLVYRHEYNKLRYVLEVLNFFGSPGAAQANGTCFQGIGIRHLPPSHPPPAWQRVSNAIYVYSAYWDHQDEKANVKAIAIGVLNENLNYGCYLWFPAQNEPIKGVFDYSGIPRKNQKMPVRNNLNSKYFSKSAKNKGYLFYCDPAEPLGIPYGVTFYNKNSDDAAQAYVPVSYLNTSTLPKNTTTAAICVLPSETQLLKKSAYMDFLVFHNMLGISDFYIYGGEYLHNILAALHSTPGMNMAVESLQWNYPFVTDYDLMRTVAESDCLLRTKHLYNFAVPLSWGQMLVPKFHSKISTMLHDFDPEDKVPKFLLPVILFCLEYNDDPQSNPELPLIYRKSRYALPKSNISVVASRLGGVGSAMQKISREITAVHWYTKCDFFDLKVVDKTQPKVDHTMLRFHSKLSISNGMLRCKQPDCS